MDEYIVSARKYRPDTFESVVGQDAITQTLKNSIKNNQLGQAYLFCGPRGVGKTTCARIFAKTINCCNPSADYEPCNECESCRAFIESRSFNIHELDAASNNSVDDIRALIEQVRIPPQVGTYSVYIIDEVHMLSQQAFNAFLKTLEEPPKHAIFILATTEKHKILSTILSRCQIFDFNRISVEDIRQRLQFVAQREGIEAEQDALHVIAQKADGAMRDALSIFDQIVSFCGKHITYKETIKNLNVLDYEVYFEITNAILSGNYSDALVIFDNVIRKGFEGGYFINGLASHYRDLLVCKDQGTLSLIEVGEMAKQKYMEFAQKCSPAFLFNAIQVANSCDMSYKTSQNKRLLIELSLLKLCQLATNVFAMQPVAVAQPAQQPVAPVANPQRSVVAESPAVSQQLPPKPVETVQKPVLEQPAQKTAVEVEQKHVEMPKSEPSSDAKANFLKNIVGLDGKSKRVEETSNEYQPTTEQFGEKPYEPADVVVAWKDFASKKWEKDPRWYNYFNDHLPEYKDVDKYIVRVEDVKKQQGFLRGKQMMLDFIRKFLDNRNFDFEYIVDESLIITENQIVKTQSEMLEDIKNSNPSVNGIIIDGDFSQV